MRESTQVKHVLQSKGYSVLRVKYACRERYLLVPDIQGSHWLAFCAISAQLAAQVTCIPWISSEQRFGEPILNRFSIRRRDKGSDKGSDSISTEAIPGDEPASP